MAWRRAVGRATVFDAPEIGGLAGITKHLANAFHRLRIGQHQQPTRPNLVELVLQIRDAPLDIRSALIAFAGWGQTRRQVVDLALHHGREAVGSSSRWSTAPQTQCGLERVRSRGYGPSRSLITERLESIALAPRLPVIIGGVDFKVGLVRVGVACRPTPTASSSGTPSRWCSNQRLQAAENARREDQRQPGGVC
jgi:hypothetical protein